MIVFITSIKHPRNSRSYKWVWHLLNNTLSSVCNQLNKDFRVIVVCNRELPLKIDAEKILKFTEFIKVDFPPVSQIGMKGIRLDRGTKYAIGLLAARKYNPDYVMFFDADDYIASNISEYVNARLGENGWIISKGYIMLCAKLKKLDGFNLLCGTSNILNYNFIASHMPLELNTFSSRDKIIELLDDRFLMFILGSHKFAGEYCKEKNKPLKDFPYRGVIWFMGTTENHSIPNGIPKLIVDQIRYPLLWFSMAKEDKDLFNIQPERIQGLCLYFMVQIGRMAYRISHILHKKIKQSAILKRV